MPHLGWLVAIPILAYGCPAWHSILLCFLVAGLLAAACVFMLAILRELWILHQLRGM